MDPRPSSEDESALRKFIRSAYLEEKWKLGSSSNVSAVSQVNALSVGGLDVRTPLSLDLSSSYAVQAPQHGSESFNLVSAVPLHAIEVGSPVNPVPAHMPVDLPLPRESALVPAHVGKSPSSGHPKSSTNPLDLISWDEQPAANTMPNTAVVEQAPPRRPVYHVQHSSTPAESESPVPLGASVAYQSPPPIQKPSAELSAELQIKQLQDLLQAQQRQFQHQLQEQQQIQQQLHQQLQQSRVNPPQQQQHMAYKPMPISQSAVSASTLGVAGSPPAGHVKMFLPSSSPYGPPTGVPPHMMHPQAQQQQQPIMVLGPNGQLVPLMQASAASPTMSQHLPPQHQQPTAASTAKPPTGINFAPLMTATGQAMMAPPTSPLLTNSVNSPSALPTGSIGPHYVPAPGGGYQAVYMVPTGTLPPGAFKKTSVPAPAGTQKPSHGPVMFGPSPTGLPKSVGYPDAAVAAYPTMPLPPQLGYQPTGNQEDDDFALALRLQQEEDTALERERRGSGHAPQPQRAQVHAPAPHPKIVPPSAGPQDSYFQDSLVANASYIANDEALARQLAAAELSDDEEEQ